MLKKNIFTYKEIAEIVKTSEEKVKEIEKYENYKESV